MEVNFNHLAANLQHQLNQALPLDLQSKDQLGRYQLCRYQPGLGQLDQDRE